MSVKTALKSGRLAVLYGQAFKGGFAPHARTGIIASLLTLVGVGLFSRTDAYDKVRDKVRGWFNRGEEDA